jgi:hypothetical protein
MFRNIANAETIKFINPNYLKISKLQLRNFLTKRYAPRIVDCLLRVLQPPAFINNQMYLKLVKQFSTLSIKEIFGLVFQMYDADGDGFLGSNDMLYLLQQENTCIQEDFMNMLRKKKSLLYSQGTELIEMNHRITEKLSKLAKIAV